MRDTFYSVMVGAVIAAILAVGTWAVVNLLLSIYFILSMLS
jgi:hypothetical protein